MNEMTIKIKSMSTIINERIFFCLKFMGHKIKNYKYLEKVYGRTCVTEYIHIQDTRRLSQLDFSPKRLKLVACGVYALSDCQISVYTGVITICAKREKCNPYAVLFLSFFL